MARQRKLPRGMRKRGNIYYAWFQVKGRGVRRRLSSDFDTACMLLNDLRARADRGDFGIHDNDFPYAELRKKFLAWAKQQLRSWKSYEEDLDMIERYQKIVSVRQITTDFVLGFRDWRIAGGGCRKAHTVCPRTINRQVGTLHRMLNWAAGKRRRGITGEKLIAANPIDGIEPLAHETPTKQRRSLTVAEVESIFSESPDYLRPVWRMFMVTGIRKRELIGMKFEHVDFDRKSVTIPASNAKNKRAREIPLDDSMLAMIVDLQAYASERTPMAGHTAAQTAKQYAAFSRDHVFVTKANTPWRNNLLTRFYAICKRASIDGAERGGSVDIHSLRVSFITLAIEFGASPKAVQEIVGHRTLGLTMNTYARATDQSKRKAVGSLPFAQVSSSDQVISMHRNSA